MNPEISCFPCKCANELHHFKFKCQGKVKISRLCLVIMLPWWLISFRTICQKGELLVFINLREKILTWTRIRTRVSSFTRWCCNQLSYPGKSQDQARILLLLDPHYPSDQYYCHLFVMEENTYVGITLNRSF